MHAHVRMSVASAIKEEVASTHAHTYVHTCMHLCVYFLYTCSDFIGVINACYNIHTHTQSTYVYVRMYVDAYSDCVQQQILVYTILYTYVRTYICVYMDLHRLWTLPLTLLQVVIVHVQQILVNLPMLSQYQYIEQVCTYQ